MTTSCFKYKRNTVLYYKRISLIHKDISYLIKYKAIVDTDKLKMMSLHLLGEEYNIASTWILAHCKAVSKEKLERMGIFYTYKKISREEYIKLLLGGEANEIYSSKE